METNDHCPVEATLELIGGKYKALILWHLSDRTLRFNELQKAIPSVTARVLTHQLRELEAQNLGILIWDGFRPVSAQAALWDICPDARYVSHPVTGTRAHCRGNAVDLTLCNLETGEKLEMPTGFDDFSEKAETDYFEKQEFDGSEVRKNRQILRSAMEGAGFTNLPSEWWHYDYGNENWAKYSKNKAIYKGIFELKEVE
jgi:D-alanyl-D-alanine dipeptidase